MAGDPRSAGKASTAELGVDEKRALLTRLLVRRAAQPRRAPLSYGQERLWLVDQIEPGSPAYNMPSALLLEGDLKVSSLARAFAEVVRRHGTLRTRFVLRDGVPVQEVDPADPARPLPLVDLSGLPGDGVEERAGGLVGRLALRPFRLAAEHPFRVLLLRLPAASLSGVGAGQRHVLLVCLHHIVADEWSRGILLQEMAALYTAFQAGEASPLEDLPLQYADFARWQRRTLGAEALAEQLEYWRRTLGDDLPEAVLPADHPRPPVRSSRGAVESAFLDPGLEALVEARGRRFRATPFMILLAGFQALLARYGEDRRIVVGTPVAHRDRPQLEGFIGFFVNSLVLVTDLRGNPSFDEVVERVRRVCLGAFAHQDLPFERLVEALQPERRRDRTPLFQISFSFADLERARGEAAAPVRFRLPGLRAEPFGLERSTSKYDLSLYLRRAGGDGTGGGTFLASLLYSTDLFTAPTARRLLGHFRVLLRAGLDRPQDPLGRLPLLGPGESHQLCREWNDTGGAAARPEGGGTVVEAIAAAARRAPEAEAVVAGGRWLTRGELAARSERLARRLVARGAGPQTVVALYLDRTVEAVIALIAVLRSGAAYVPLAPEQPAERLGQILAESGARLLLTDSALAADHGEALGTLCAAIGREIELVRVDEPPEAGEESSSSLPALPPPPAAESLAYVLFTSGSTGRPKGVAVEHRQLAAYVAAVHRRLGLESGMRFASVSTLAADLGHTALFPALTGVGCLHLVSEAALFDGSGMAREVGEAGVDLLKIVPSHLAALGAGGDLPRLLPRRRLVLGGEACSWEQVSRAAEARPELAVFNHYGPTEATVGVLTERLYPHAPGRRWEEPRPVTPPLGRPLPGTRVHLLDPGFEPVPAGVPGHLHIAGDTLARGYFGRPARTAESFVPDPWSPEPGGRLYRTGDRAIRLPDGRLRFSGRIDDQVKIRGHRVEPGEVTATLAAHPAVAEAAVVVGRSPAGVILMAFAVAGESEPEETAPGEGKLEHALLRHLADRLPTPMLPPAVLLVPEIPLTANGKIDRTALSQLWEQAGAGTTSAFVAPRTTLEHRIARIWEDVLPVERVGIRDDFFDLGGHSLLAIRVLAEMRRELGCELPVSIFFEAGTVEEMARAVFHQRGFTGASPLVRIQPGQARPPLVLVHPQGGQLLCYLPLARALGNSRPVFGLTPPVPLPYETFRELAAAYADAVRSRLPDGPYLLAGWSFGALLAFEIGCQLAAGGHPPALLALLDCQAPIPGSPRRENPLLSVDTRDPMGLLEAVETVFDLEVPVDREGLLRQPPEERLDAVLRAAREAQVLPPELGPREIDQALDGLRHLFALRDGWEPRPYPGRLTVIRAEEAAPGTRPERIAFRRRYPALGWEELSETAPEVHTVPGDHLSMILPPEVDALAALLGRLLARAAGKGEAEPEAGERTEA